MRQGVIKYLNEPTILSIHHAAIEEFGGADGIGDRSLFEAALAQPMQTFDGQDLYPTLEDKAARYAYGFIKDHPFIDGNKRTGAAVIFAFLRNNGRHFKPRLKDMQDMILSIADGSKGYDDLVEWLKAQPL
jgi:death-on-curing protein